MTFYEELKRRNVFRVGAAYIVAAWLLIQVAETLFPLFGYDDTPARIVVIVLAIGFPIFLVFSWVFEITPEGLKKETDVDRAASVTHKTGNQLDRIIMVMLALALGYFAFDKFVLAPARDAELVEETTQQVRSEGLVESYGEKSIAVLPFINMSDDAGNEYFSDGISEELLNLLAKIPELRVISRSSSFSFKGKDIAIPTIAKQLNVVNVLEGSVRKMGNRVRITAQLIEARSDTHLWSETYDRTLDNIFTIQDEIAAAVVAHLKITLLADAPRVKETNPEAYGLYLQARHLALHGTVEGLEQSSALYQQALALAPDYAAAWVGLTASYINQAGKVLPVNEGYALAREAANRTLVIDPENALAHAALGWISWGIDGDLAAAARHLERALELGPENLSVIGAAAILAKSLGRLDKAIALEEYAVARNPVSAKGYANLGDTYRLMGHLDEALASYRTALTLSPGMYGVQYQIGLALLFKGEPEAALAEFVLEGEDEYRVKGTALALYALGRQTEYEIKLQELIKGWGDEWPSEVAHVYAFTGEADTAFQWLDRVIEQNEEGLSEQFLHPFFTPLHADPRWAEFLNRVGSSPAQLDAIKFEATVPQ